MLFFLRKLLAKPVGYGLLFLLVLLLVVFGFSRCPRAPLQVQQLAPLPQHPLIQVYFNHDQSSSYTDPYRQQTRPGDDLEQIIVDSINSAKTTVDLAVQELRLPRIAQALKNRHAAGVRARVILENTYSRPWSSLTATEVAQLDARESDRYNEYRQLVDRDQDGQITQAEINQGDALQILHQAGIPWIDDTADGSTGSGLMHHKFVVIDGQTVIVTSANFTTSDINGDFSSPASQGNANSLLHLQSPPLATIFTQEFNLMWGDGPGKQPNSLFGVKKPFRPAQQLSLGEATVEVQFSPTSPTIPWQQSSNGLIGSTLSRARTSVDMALFVFSEQRLANLLEIDHQKGVTIRALIEPEFAYRSYSEALDLLGVALSSTTAKSGCHLAVTNHPWQHPIRSVGVPQLPKGDLLHHKYGVVDQRVVIVGSHNWSEAANQTNDETLMVIDHPTVAAHYQREFERLYANSILGLTKSLQRKLQKQQQQCSAIQATSLEPDSEQATASRANFQSSPAIASTSLNPTPQRINLNTASQQELESLPQVGPKLAERIIQARQQKPFTSLSDLDQVAGVGPSLLQKLTDRVTW